MSAEKSAWSLVGLTPRFILEPPLELPLKEGYCYSALTAQLISILVFCVRRDTAIHYVFLQQDLTF